MTDRARASAMEAALVKAAASDPAAGTDPAGGTDPAAGTTTSERVSESGKSAHEESVDELNGQKGRQTAIDDPAVLKAIAAMRTELEQPPAIQPPAEFDHYLARFLLATGKGLHARQAAATFRKVWAIRQKLGCDAARDTVRSWEDGTIENLPHNTVVQQFFSHAMCDLAVTMLDGVRH